MKPINAILTKTAVCSNAPLVGLTFQIKKEDLAGLEYTRPEFVLEITPAEKLFEK